MSGLRSLNDRAASLRYTYVLVGMVDTTAHAIVAIGPWFADDMDAQIAKITMEGEFHQVTKTSRKRS